MKKLIIAAALGTLLMAPQVFAQAGNFRGFSAGLTLNVAETKTEDVFKGVSKSATDTDNNIALQLQYNMALNDVFVLGLGGTANLGDLKAGKIGTSQIKEKEAYSLYVAPGYAFNNNWLGYGKLSYLNANLDNGGGGSVKFDEGYGYGLGLQVLFTKNWFGQAEYMINQYADRTPSAGETVKLKSGIYALTAGYKF